MSRVIGGKSHGGSFLQFNIIQIRASLHCIAIWKRDPNTPIFQNFVDFAPHDLGTFCTDICLLKIPSVFYVIYLFSM